MSEINLNRFSGFIKPKESEQKGLAQPEKKRIIGTRGSRTEIKTALWALSTVIFLIVLCICLGMNRKKSAKENTKVRKDRRVSA